MDWWDELMLLCFRRRVRGMGGGGCGLEKGKGKFYFLRFLYVRGIVMRGWGVEWFEVGLEMVVQR